MAQYLDRNPTTGKPRQVAGLAQSAGVADASKIVQTDTNGRLHPSLMPLGIGADTRIIEASENISAGSFVNVFDDAGTTKVRNADATSVAKEAHGFVTAAVNAAENATVYFEGTNDQLTGLTGGLTYFLSDTTPGGVTATPVTGANKLSQILGIALDANSINFEGEPAIELA